MVFKTLSITLSFLFLVSCNAYDEYGCNKYEPDCVRNYDVSFPYSFSPAKDTYQLGETVIWNIELPYEVWDTSTNKYITVENFEMFPEFIFVEIDFEERTYQIPSYSVVNINAILNMDDLDTSNFQGTMIGNRYYFNLEEQEDKRVARLEIEFITKGSYMLSSLVDPYSNSTYEDGRIRFDTLDDVCCLQKIDPKFIYMGEIGGYHKWFQKDSIFSAIGFDGKRYAHNMLDPWANKDKKLIFHVVE